MVDPRLMCDRHLLGEHYECHMFAGCINKGKTLTGYITGGLLDPASLTARHNRLVKEMHNRGFSHLSPMGRYKGISSPIDSAASLRDLLTRCRACADKYEK